MPAAITLRVSRHDTPEPVKPDPRPVDAVPPGAPPATEPVSSTAPTAAPDKDAAPEPEVADTDFPGDTFLAVNERDSINPLPFPFLRVMMPEPMSAWVLVNVYITREGVVKAHEVLSGAGDWRFVSLLERFLTTAPIQPVRRNGSPIGAKIQYRFEAFSSETGGWPDHESLRAVVLYPR